MSFSERFCNYYPPLLEPAVQAFQTNWIVTTPQGELFDLSRSPEQTEMDNMRRMLRKMPHLDAAMAEIRSEYEDKYASPSLAQYRLNVMGELLSGSLGIITVYRFGEAAVKAANNDYPVEAFINGTIAYISLNLLFTLNPKARETIRRIQRRYS